jgi:hypothetical protein
MTRNIKRSAVLFLLITLIGFAKSSRGQIRYHNGATLPTPINVYLIWYGNWSSATRPTQMLVEQFVSDFGNSRYAHTNETYSGYPMSAVFTLSGSATDQYSQGSIGILPFNPRINERTVYDIVMQNAQANGWNTADPAAIFIVLTSADLDASEADNGTSGLNFGGPNGFCGWHASVDFFVRFNNFRFSDLNGSQNVRFGFVGDPARYSGCTYSLTPPNSNAPSGDIIINHLAHELLEAANDPDHSAWYFDSGGSNGNESGDQCAFQTGPFLPAPGGGVYNLHLNGSYYLVQQEWVNFNSGYCAMISSAAAPTPSYPYDGLLHAPSSFQLTWNDGLNGTIEDANHHPVSYTLYYKYWPYNGIEPNSYRSTGPVPCNSGNGTCVSAASVGDGFFRWYVEANIDTSAPPHNSPSMMTTRSSVATFTVGCQPVGTVTPLLKPNPIYPYNGLQGVAPDFIVQWNDGLDATRRNSPLWPVTYAIYYKYWPFGGVEPQNYILVTDKQLCNPVYTGICQTYETGEPAGNFKWKVIANMDAWRFTCVSPTMLSTESDPATFTVGYPQ